MGGASQIRHSQCNTVIISEIKLSQITVKMLFAAMLINALYPALKDAEKAFNRVRVNLAAHIFISAVADKFVARKILVQVLVLARFVRHDRRFFGDIGANNRHKLGSAGTINMEGTNSAATFDKRQNGALSS